jgi:glycosyltransferase involved in cell wall biosynthesis
MPTARPKDVQLPRVSLVTPSYNQARYLADTIESVRRNRDDVAEYIVLDGGSSDGSPEIIASHGAHIDFWRSEKDGGQAAAIDDGFRRATGDVLGWINSDDLLLDGAIAAVRRAFALHPEWAVVTGWSVVVDQDSRVVRARRTEPQTLDAARWGVMRVSQPACFFRRDAYEAVGGLDRTLGCVMDTELWYRLLRRYPRWGHIDRFLAAFRLHGDQKGAKWLAQYQREYALMRQRYPEFAGAGLKHRVGRLAYRGRHLAGGSYLSDALLSWRARGRRVSEFLAEEA